MKKKQILFLIIISMATFLFAEGYFIGSLTNIGTINEISSIQGKDGYYKVAFHKNDAIFTYTVKKGSTILFEDWKYEKVYSYYVEDVKDNAISLKKIEVQ